MDFSCILKTSKHIIRRSALNFSKPYNRNIKVSLSSILEYLDGKDQGVYWTNSVVALAGASLCEPSTEVLAGAGLYEPFTVVLTGADSCEPSTEVSVGAWIFS